MPVVPSVVRSWYENYCKWVAEHPKGTSEIEQSLQWMTYFVSGRLSPDQDLSEIIYCFFNLVILLNDHAYSRSSGGGAVLGNDIKTWLTVVEYCQVCLEVGSQKRWGEKGRWATIAAVQLFKCAARLTLLLKQKESLVPHPPIRPLHRDAELDHSPDPPIHPSQVSFVLKSGVEIKKVDYVSNLKCGLIDIEHSDFKQAQPLSRNQRFAEILYIIKPIIHLWALKHSKKYSWGPFLSALLMDGISLSAMVRDPNYRKFNRTQKQQVVCRMAELLMYLARSPFYDRHTKHLIVSILLLLSRVPWLGFIATSIKKYIPRWQKMYFYIWSH